jgi:hypothetical protein
MKRKMNKIVGFELFRNDGEVWGTEVKDISWYVNTISRDTFHKIEGKHWTYLFWSNDESISYNDCVDFAVRHYNQQTQLKRRFKKPPPANRGVEN